MFWYEIDSLPGYRISPLGEVMSLLGDEPLIMKVWNHRVTVRQNGKSVSFSIPKLMEMAGISVNRGFAHPEAMRDRCDQGHEFTKDNTMRRKGKYGDIRKCRRCHNDSMRRYRATRRARPPTSPGGR